MLTVSIGLAIIAVLITAAFISKKRLKDIPEGKKEKKSLITKETLLFYGKGLGAGAMAGTAVIIIMKISHPALAVLMITACTAAGFAMALITKKRLNKKEEERIDRFSKEVYGAYALAKKSYEELDGNGDIQFTQLELRRLDPILTAFEIYEQQLKSGRVDNDAAEKLRQLADEMAAINEARMKRSNMNTGDKDARREKQDSRSNPAGRKKDRQQQAPSYFKGCKDAESVKARYRNLCRTFHPDTGSGDADSFREMNEEYHRLLKKYAKEA